ncbi:CAP domain-containing protein [Inediibacterium massiliense]|uniref:CAP domain-containing protein n=1 Tax=Inediibacterium massiliense TaxID=1658111 RepID=UPI0006B4710E|nr:CAP domain-containing protein [Inediibacterium massiliense]
MKKIISLLVLSVFLLTSCTTPQQKPKPKPIASSIFEKGQVKQIQITKDNATCRSGQGENTPIVKNLSKGDIYDVIGQSEDWYVIQTNDKKVGTVSPSEAKPHVQPTKTSAPEATTGKLTSNEDEMFRLVNGERTKQGLKPLQLDMEVTKVARIKAQDLIDNNYFSHNSPTYGSPFDMLKKFGAEYAYAGENLAGNQSVQAAHTALMNSKGHRENILNPNFTHIGIGIKDGGQYGKMFTQMFIGK